MICISYNDRFFAADFVADLKMIYTYAGTGNQAALHTDENTARRWLSDHSLRTPTRAKLLLDAAVRGEGQFSNPKDKLRTEALKTPDLEQLAVLGLTTCRQQLPHDPTIAAEMPSVALLPSENPFVRLSGTLAERREAARAIGAYYYATDEKLVYLSTGKEWILRGEPSAKSLAGRSYGLEADRPPASKMIGWIYEASDTGRQYEGFPSEDGQGVWFQINRPAESLTPTLSDSGLAKLRSSLSNQFGALLRSTGEGATLAPVTYVVAQTLDASPTKPILVEFQQHILEAFTGDGRFDIVESDPADDVVRDDENEIVSGGDSLATLATKTGFADGVTTGAWSRFAKVITSDKVFSVVGAPGDTGIGAFSLTVQPLLEVR